MKMCGVNDENYQKRLLSTENLTLQTAFDLAQSIESATKNIRILHRNLHSSKFTK